MKPLRPFPLPLNIGTDICQISRIYGILAGPRRGRFVARVLTPEELGARGKFMQQLEAQKTQDGAAALEAGSHEILKRRDPELWKTAAFVAGRYRASHSRAAGRLMG